MPVHRNSFLRRRIQRWFTSDPEALEIYMALTTIGWGVWIFVFSSFGSTPTFKTMASMAAEPIWAAVCCTIGVYQIYAAAHDLRMHRIVATTIHGVLWLVIASTFFLSNPRGTGTFTYGMFAIGSLWINTRLRLSR